MKKKSKDHPYVLCTLYGFGRVPDTAVLLKAEDYKQFMKYLEKAAEDNPDTDIQLDPDDCGECYIELEEFMKHHISAKPIKAETYEDICQSFERKHFGFNYVLDAVLSAVYDVVGQSLTSSEVKWFADRSETVGWVVEDEKRRKEKSEKIDKQAVYLAANGLRNCGTEVCQLVSNQTVDMQALRQQIDKIAGYLSGLESLLPV